MSSKTTWYALESTCVVQMSLLARLNAVHNKVYSTSKVFLEILLVTTDGYHAVCKAFHCKDGASVVAEAM